MGAWHLANTYIPATIIYSPPDRAINWDVSKQALAGDLQVRNGYPGTACMGRQKTYLPELCERFSLDRFHRPQTRAHYRRVLAIFMRDTGKQLLEDISRDIVLTWRCCCLVERGLSPSSWNNYARHMRALMHFARDCGLCAEDPFSRVTVTQPAKKKRVVSPSDWDRLMKILRDEVQASENNPRRDRFGASWLWMILLSTSDKTGMRLRQLVTLAWKDLDFERRVIRLRVEGSKTSREWDIPMHEELVAELTLLKHRTEYALECEPVEQQVFNVNLFSHRHQLDQLTDAQVCAFCKHLYKVSGVRISPHRLRHTLATDLMRQPERNLNMVKNLLGHTSIRTTLEYVSTDMEELRTLVNTHRKTSPI